MQHFKVHRDIVFSLVVVAFCVGLVLLPDYQNPAGWNEEYARYLLHLGTTPIKGGNPFERKELLARASVLSVDNSEVVDYERVNTGRQKLRVRLLNGPFKEQATSAINPLVGQMEADKLFVPGDTVFVILDLDGERVVGATAYDYVRTEMEVILVILFVLLLIGFAGWPGARALLSFVFALLLIWKVLLPGTLRGGDPVLLALIVVTAMTAVTLVLVAGVGRMALVAGIGAQLGILLTWGMASLLLPALKLHGAIQAFAEQLYHSGFYGLDLTRIFLAAVFVGASGAVLDVAVDVSTAMKEVIEKRPDLSRRDLLRSGFAVGRNMTSTMVTTLLMAYASGYMILLMLFLAQGIPPLHALNTNYVAAEVLKTVVGSIGLVTVAPFTAVVGSVLYTVQFRRRG